MPELEGTVERITFHNRDNGYTVFRFREAGTTQIHTAVGTTADMVSGEVLRLTGDWVNHSEYGKQFQFESFIRLSPSTLTGIEKYLGSGLIKGIGPETARRIVKTFGLASLEMIRDNPGRLMEVEGIGEKKCRVIAGAVIEQKHVQDIMVFLQGLGISPGFAARIYKTYGAKAIEVVNRNPYRLAEDVFGIGFKTADKIAQAKGIPVDSPDRLIAGMEFFLSEMAGEGHVYAVVPQFLADTAENLGVDPGLLEPLLMPLVQRRTAVIEVSSGGEAGSGRLVYPAPFFHAECGVAQRLNRLSQPFPLPGLTDIDSRLERVQQEKKIRLAPAQAEAVKGALKYGATVITGGPGTGKTTTLRVLLAMLQMAGQKVALSAPTGRAAKRMAEATGYEAKTLHRLLEFGNEGGGFRFGRNEEKPLDADVVVVDEVSMVDLLLMHNLLKAIPDGTRLVLVGDADQLPSVGAGNVLRDVIISGTVPVIRLEQVFRQDNKSYIALNAHQIKAGKMPVLSADLKDFFFIEQAEPDDVVKTIMDLVSRRLPKYLRCHPIEDIQVITPMRRTVTGVENLNRLLQPVLNRPGPETCAVFRDVTYRPGDKVMQIRNNYQKMVFNGDIGRIVAVDGEERELRVAFPDPAGDRVVGYDFQELDELVLSYAVSVHKSQGSEYPVVVMPITTQHYVMLQRNLIYTAITRAKRMVVMVGTRKALAMAIRNNKIEERRSLLSQRLKSLVQGTGVDP